MVDRYITAPADVIVPRRVRLSSTLTITHHPVEDPGGPGLAHVTYDGALEVAAANGARLPTTAEILALHLLASAAGTELPAVTLPDSFLMAQGCVPGDPRMVSREWCERHDGIVMAAGAKDMDTDVPCAGWGKHWRHGAPDGLAGICGWWVPKVELYSKTRRGPGFVQAGDDWPHNRQHADYATTLMLVWVE